MIKGTLVPLMLLLSGCVAQGAIHNLDPIALPKPLQVKCGSQLRGITRLAPVQPLELLPGSRAYYQEEQGYLQLGDHVGDDLTLWQQLNQWLLAQQINVIARHPPQKMITTDWIDWPNAGVVQPHRARYRLSVQRLANKPTLVIRLTAWQPLPSTLGYENDPPDPNSRRHDTLLLMNRISVAWEKERAIQARAAQRRAACEKPPPLTLTQRKALAKKQQEALEKAWKKSGKGVEDLHKTLLKRAVE